MQAVDIHGFAGSTYVRTARMTCEEKGVPHRLVPLEFRADSHHALHPFLRMPILTAGKQRLYETLAIASYIDRTGKGPSLQPDDAAAHAEMLQWISVCNDYLYNDVIRVMLQSETPSAVEQATARRDLEVVDRSLFGRKFLTGANLTLADLFLAPIVAYAMSKPCKKLFGGLESLHQWHERMAERPSFQATAP